MTIRVLLVDDQSLFRSGLAVILSTYDQLEIVGEAENGRRAIELSQETFPDVILMDIRMPIMSGIEATRQLVQSKSPCKIILLTTFDDEEEIIAGVQGGASGYILKDVEPDELVNAIEIVWGGESYLQPSITSILLRKIQGNHFRELDVSEPLSRREMDVLRAMATGSSNREIANELVLAEGTVKNHITNIFGKLHVKDRMRAVLRAKELGYLNK